MVGSENLRDGEYFSDFRLKVSSIFFSSISVPRREKSLTSVLCTNNPHGIPLTDVN